MKSKKYLFFAAAGLIVVCLLLGVYATLRGDTRKGSSDDLVGWYEMERGDKVIPVFKREGNYYSVSHLYEIPFKKCAEGLEPDWPGLEGTVIGFSKELDSYYIIIQDHGSPYYEETNREPKRLKKIPEPKGLLPLKATPPATNNDFVGWYQFVWCPYIRYEIQKEDEKYIIVAQEMGRDRKWKLEDGPVELVSLPDRLGFIYNMHGKNEDQMHITYCAARNRFEITVAKIEGNANEMSSTPPIPLARIPAPPSPEADAVPIPKVRIGIPLWR